MKIHVGTMHARPDVTPFNARLKALGSDWRITTAKSIGLHSYHPNTGECRLVDDQGFATIPDIEESPKGFTSAPTREELRLTPEEQGRIQHIQNMCNDSAGSQIIWGPSHECPNCSATNNPNNRCCHQCGGKL